MRLKLETITGTGSAITSTPLREQIEPNIFPAIVLGTISPYLKEREKARGGGGGGWGVLALIHVQLVSTDCLPEESVP